MNVQELSNMKRLNKIVAEAAQINVWTYDVSSHEINLICETENSLRMREKLNICHEKLERDSFLFIVAEDDIPTYLETFSRIESGADMAEADLRLQLTDENPSFYIHLAMYRFLDNEKKSDIVYGFTQDVTLRKLSEMKYTNVSRQIMQIYPSTTASVQLNLTRNWCGEPQGQNASIFLTEQGSADEFFRNLVDHVADSDIKEHLKNRANREWLVSAFYHGRSEFSFEYPLLLPDGNRTWRNGRLLLMQNPISGDIEGIACNIDINDQKRREQIMRRISSDEFDFVGLLNPQDSTFEFFYRKSDSIYSQMDEIADYDKDRKIMRSAVVSPKDFNQWWKDTSIRKICSKLKKDGRYSITYESIENGEVNRRLLRYYWLDQPDGDVLIMHSDITAIYAQEQRQIQRTQRALAAAEQANQAKAEFVSRVSHDIRSPIGLVNNLTNFAIRDIDDREKLLEDLKKLRSVGDLLLSLVNDVLDVAKLDSGTLELKLTPCSYRELMGDMIHIFETLCEQKHQIFTIEETGMDYFQHFFVDKVRIKQLLLNLVSNAVKYTPDGGRITLIISAREEKPGHCLITMGVRDTGIGMSKAFQKRMFRPFAQENENPYRQEGTVSTGLGLSIVKNIAELMKGTLSVESTVGKGTTIKLEFQAKLTEASQAAEASTDEIDKPQKRKRLQGKVLIAEDNEINGEIAQRILDMLGIDSVWEKNGARALKRFCHSKPREFAAILLDVQMPIMTGYQTAEYIRLLRRPDAQTIPIIAMTADAFDEAMERARKSGMDAYLSKPIEPRKLENLLLSCMENTEKETTRSSTDTLIEDE